MYKHYTLNGMEYIQRVTDNAYIPTSPDNTDYQVYLAWLAEGNTPLPADVVTGE